MMKTPTGFQIGKSLIWVIITDMSTERDKGINLTCGLLSSFDSWPIKLRRLDWLIKIHSWAQNEEEIIEIIPNYETEKLYKIDKKSPPKIKQKMSEKSFCQSNFLDEDYVYWPQKKFYPACFRMITLRSKISCSTTSSYGVNRSRQIYLFDLYSLKGR